MDKKYIILIVVLALICSGAYVLKDFLFFESEYSEFKNEFLTKEVAFDQNTPETEILGLKVEIEKQPGITSVIYISIEEGIERLIENNPIIKDDPEIMKAASENILPRLIIHVNPNNAHKNLEVLNASIASSSAAAYIK